MLSTNQVTAVGYHVGDIAWQKRFAYALTFNFLLIASAYIQIPLPFSPVPVTAQTLAVLACGLFLGPVLGAMTVLAYLTGVCRRFGRFG